nr:MAG TPA: NlpE N-terminal domain [Crassvirales sp.]
MGLPSSYYDKTEEVEIKNYRGVLPCDVMYI